MAQAILVAHLPLLRMVRNEDVRFGGGLLTKLPWEQFDGLTQGAFTDWKRNYLRTDPVFFWYEPDFDLPFVRQGSSRGMQEMKLPQEAWPTLLPRLGLGLLTGFHQHLVDPVWAALALAAPAGILPPPRSSVTFMLPVGEAYFEFGDQSTNGVRLQGDADLELAYLADGAGAPVGDDTLKHAAELVDLARFALEHPALGPSLRQLLMCGDVTLQGSESLLLAVAGIESLLLPDASAASGETFARRLAHLLGADDASRARVHRVARVLYRRRTAVLHSDGSADAGDDLPPAVAEQLLAGAIVAGATAVASGMSVETLRTQLDTAPTNVEGARVPLLDTPPGRGGWSRLGPAEPWTSATFSLGSDLRSPEGTILSWSPLIGLAHDGETLVHEDLRVAVTSMSADALVSMEDKDVRRDFIANVRSVGTLAALATGDLHSDLNVTEHDVLPLTRRRDLAVLGLRLAGFDAFADPELLGWYVYAKTLRYRRQTVLRQSVIMHLQTADALPLDEDARTRVWEAWSLLARYNAEARHEEIDQLLDLVRRLHDRRFLPPTTRAALAIIAVEAMLGRFRPATATLRLERLVQVLPGVPDETRRWFETEGRAFRNQVAHGEWAQPPVDATEIWTHNPQPIAHFVVIARGALRQLLEVWVAADPPVRARYGPARVLVRHLARQAR